MGALLGLRDSTSSQVFFVDARRRKDSRCFLCRVLDDVGCHLSVGLASSRVGSREATIAFCLSLPHTSHSPLPIESEPL